MKIALYCQNVLGIGHLSRSLNLARELVTHHQLHFIQGGPKVDLTLNHPHFHHHYLPPLLMDLEGKLFAPGLIEIDKVWNQRQNELEAIGSRPFDIVLVEFFPFGRYQFKDEILRFIDSQRRLNPKCKVICSMRDIYTLKNNPAKVQKRARYSAECLNRYFDLLLIHSDPDFIRLEDSYPYLKDIKIPLTYTGYIAPPKQYLVDKVPHEILVSTGGGSWGDELLSSVELIAREFPKLSFHIFLSALGCGSNSAATSKNLHYHLFNEQEFKKHLARASLSLSLAGYNTLVEALRYQTPMLLWPFKHNNEQPLRARIFNERSLAMVLNDEKPLPDQLRKFLSEAFPSPCALTLPRLEGAVETLNIINNL